MKDPLKIGLFGFGTVGKGVYHQLIENADSLRTRYGKTISVARIVVAHPDKHERQGIASVPFSGDINSILADPEIDVVLELTGHPELAETVIRSSLLSGKPVITANKALLAVKGPELYRLAAEKNTALGYEAAVCSGTPVISWLSNGYVSDSVNEIMGIFNSTTNFILTQMTRKGISFSKAIASAQARGFAEPDPSLDIVGLDSAHKLTILIHHAFDPAFSMEQVLIKGISKITQKDIRQAEKESCVIKLIGTAKRNQKGIQAWVEPEIIPNSHPLASIDDADNAVLINSCYGGSSFIKGIGAGADSAASAIIGDLINLILKPFSTHQKSYLHQ